MAEKKERWRYMEMSKKMLDTISLVGDKLLSYSQDEFFMELEKHKKGKFSEVMEEYGLIFDFEIDDSNSVFKVTNSISLIVKRSENQPITNKSYYGIKTTKSTSIVTNTMGDLSWPPIAA
ncbi:MAG: hypothetical protein J7L71_04915 [Spirochaetaceae bacterium]|nr:hypothetical protein [Spirochaetaceae bacterium]